MPSEIKQIPARIQKILSHNFMTERSRFFALTQQTGTLTHWVQAGLPEAQCYRQMCFLSISFHGILAKFPCFVCHENIAGKQRENPITAFGFLLTVEII